jgi:hypothetical protein
MEDELRISAASLTRIELDGKILVALNKKRLQAGKRVYTPFGGALEFYEEARSYLQSLGVVFEKGNDLRFTFSEERLAEFEQWFERKKDREVSPYRELREELVDEEGIFPELPEHAINLEYLTTVKKREVTNRPGQEGKLTQRFFEVYRATFKPEYTQMVREALSKPETHLALVTEKEIKAGKADSGIEIATNCLSLVIPDN